MKKTFMDRREKRKSSTLPRLNYSQSYLDILSSGIASNKLKKIKEDTKIMKVIYWPQQYGKTTELAKEAVENDGIFIAKDEASKKYVEQKFVETGLEVYTAEELLSGKFHFDKPLYIDDADIMLNKLISKYSKSDIGGIAVTMERPF